MAWTTNVANSTGRKIGVVVTWNEGSYPYHEIEPGEFVAVKMSVSSTVVVVSVRDLKTRKEIASRQLISNISVVVKYEGGKYKIYRQKYGGGMFEIDPFDK